MSTFFPEFPCMPYAFFFSPLDLSKSMNSTAKIPSDLSLFILKYFTSSVCSLLYFTIWPRLGKGSLFFLVCVKSISSFVFSLPFPLRAQRVPMESSLIPPPFPSFWSVFPPRGIITPPRRESPPSFDRPFPATPSHVVSGTAHQCDLHRLRAQKALP